jgi:hypothetical protein
VTTAKTRKMTPPSILLFLTDDHGAWATGCYGNGEVRLVLNTPFGQGTRGDGYEIRQAAIEGGVPCITTLAGILAAIQGIESLQRGDVAVRSLQDYQSQLPARLLTGEDPDVRRGPEVEGPA